MNSHLTHEQLSDLLLAEAPSDANGLSADQLERSRWHLAHCTICAGEMADLRRSLKLFRTTADAWANQAWEHQLTLHRQNIHVEALRRQRQRGLAAFIQRPAIWATAAAAAMLFGAVLPLSLHREAKNAENRLASTEKMQAPATRVSPSDEALLLEINQTLSSSVPGPMQPLADPAASDNAQANNDIRNN